MNLANCFEVGLSQANHDASDAISLGAEVLKVTVRAASDSGTNVWIGVNQQASDINLLQPGESVTYVHEGYKITDKNGRGLRLYIGFDPSNTGGKALVSITYDTKKEDCSK